MTIIGDRPISLGEEVQSFGVMTEKALSQADAILHSEDEAGPSKITAMVRHVHKGQLVKQSFMYDGLQLYSFEGSDKTLN